MRSTKIALLAFGLGLMLGFAAVVVGDHPILERVASAVMAASLAALPVTLFADGHGIRFVAWIAARFSRGNAKKKRGKARRAPPRRKPPARPATRAARHKVRR